MGQAHPLESELRELVGVARSGAERSAAIAATGYRSRPRADEKGKKDLLTDFDRRSQDALIDWLAKETPHIPVLGEEDAQESLIAEGHPLLWCVDPIDGTTNFVHGHPFWCVSVGLMAGPEPLCGAIVAPALGLWWLGIRRPEGDLAEALRNGEPCRVSETDSLERALVGTGFPVDRSRTPGNNFDSFVRVKRAAQAVRRCGSAAIDLCLVGDGTYDGYWERHLHVWDLAGAAAFALAAGAQITALDGSPPDYTVGHVIASNGRFHEALVAAVQGSA
jgi:myo-inositol-1(or 4)-monophosphatase